MRKISGFTLVELLLYVGIFTILAIAFSGILITFTRVNISQVARNEVASQINFVMQSIQLMVSNASAVVVRSATDGIDVGNNWDEIDSALGQPHKYLVIKTKEENNNNSDGSSPIVIYQEGGIVKVRKGRGAAQTIADLTNDNVTTGNLTFVKFVNYPGRDLVEIDLSLSYNSSNPQQQTSRKLVLGVGRAIAATFDTSLLPGASGSIDVGQSTQRWRDGYFSGTLNVSGSSFLATSGGSVTIGSGGSPTSGILHGIIAVDPPLIGASTSATIDVDLLISGLVPSNKVFLTPPQLFGSTASETGLVLQSAQITSTGLLRIRIFNASLSDRDGGSRTWSYLIIK